MLIEADSFKNNAGFKKILGFLNTQENKQKKGKTDMHNKEDLEDVIEVIFKNGSFWYKENPEDKV